MKIYTTYGEILYLYDLLIGMDTPPTYEELQPQNTYEKGLFWLFRRHPLAFQMIVVIGLISISLMLSMIGDILPDTLIIIINFSWFILLLAIILWSVFNLDATRKSWKRSKKRLRYFANKQLYTDEH